MGSSNRFNYSVLGDTVNIAARIESETKTIDWPILVSQATVRVVPDMAFLSVGNLLLKGKSHGVDIYALVGDEGYARSTEFMALKEQHDLLLAAAAGDERGKVSAAVKRCVALAPDKLAPLYRRFGRKGASEAPANREAE
jgi:adenylate cyclase